VKKILITSLFILASCSIDKKDFYTTQEVVFVSRALQDFDEINNLRLANGLNPLIGEFRLTQGAISQANHLFSVDSLDHYGFNSRFIYSKAKSFGEVCSYNYPTAQAEIQAYEGSLGHLNTLINPKYTHIGIGVKENYICIDLASYAENRISEICQDGTVVISNNGRTSSIFSSCYNL